MIRHDPHPAGSIDRVLVARSVGLDGRSARAFYRATPRPTAQYRRGTRPRLEACVRTIVRGATSDDARVRAIARFTASLSDRAPLALDRLRFGGTEEAIIARGSNWCTDVARVAAALAEVAGVPARIVQLADTDRAYSGHAVIEAYRDGRWGCVDSRTGVVYRDDRGRPATTWDLMRNPAWIAREYHGELTLYSTAAQFRRAAIARYRLPARTSGAYRTSRVNAYYRSILRMSERGWPGGLRWIHGEDRGRAAPDARSNRLG
jgi:transglutaminase-like putative cysteine protease